MSPKVYVYGCASCGRTAVALARVRKKYPDVQVINTKYSKDDLYDHTRLLTDSGIGVSQFHSIIKEEGVVTLLSEWKPSA